MIDTKHLLGAAALALAAMVAAPAAAGPYSDAVLAKNPYAYWRFNETSGSVAVDSSGNNRNGTYQNTPLLGQPGPLAEAGNTAVRLNAASFQNVLVSHGFGGPGWSNLTIEAWVNVAASTNTFQVLMSSPNQEFVRLMTADTGVDNLIFGSAATAQLPSPTVSQLTGWHHIVFTMDPTSQRLYRDGTLFSASFGPTGDLLATGSLLIGGGFLGGFFVNGWLDEVAIYRTTLSQAQINQNFQAASQVASTATPEPASLAILALGMAALGGMRRRAGLRSV